MWIVVVVIVVVDLFIFYLLDFFINLVRNSSCVVKKSFRLPAAIRLLPFILVLDAADVNADDLDDAAVDDAAVDDAAVDDAAVDDAAVVDAAVEDAAVDDAADDDDKPLKLEPRDPNFDAREPNLVADVADVDDVDDEKPDDIEYDPAPTEIPSCFSRFLTIIKTAINMINIRIFFTVNNVNVNVR